MKRQQSTGGHIECFKCTLRNLLTATRCAMCNVPLLSGDLPTNPQSFDNLIPCSHCFFQNDKDNKRCLKCEKLIHEEQKDMSPEFPLKILMEQLDEKECKICHSVLSAINYGRHVKECEDSLNLIKSLGSHGSIMEESAFEDCPFCNIPITKDQFQKHFKQCREKGAFDIQTFERLTPLQKNALEFMQENSQKQHFSSKNILTQRFKKLGFDAATLEAVGHYIENYAPIIVHIHITKHMEFFVKDTHYRNQFETGKSSGSLSRTSRISWQKRMFFGRYDKAQDYERVKYGTINFTNDPKGVNSCRGYGNSYFLLKSHVRDRCTVTDQDSSSASSLIGTFKFCYHVLNRLTDNQLKAAVQAAKALEVSSAVIGTYKQIQIHGPIQFAKDIERLYVNEMEIKDKKFLGLVEQFSKRFNVDYEIFKA